MLKYQGGDSNYGCYTAVSWMPEKFIDDCDMNDVHYWPPATFPPPKFTFIRALF